MSSLPPATMARAARAGATPLRRGLPEEIVIWEILVRLPPKSLLRCRAVCRAWRRVISTRRFLLAQHGQQPSLPLVSGFEHCCSRYQDILAFDHRTAAAVQLQPVARLDGSFYPRASCDGLLILSKYDMTGICFSFCNPAARQHAPFRPPWGFTFLGMHPHRPTGEYRLLTYRSSHEKLIRAGLVPRGRDGCYVFALGCDQPPRYIGLPGAASACLDAPVLLRGSLHFYPVQLQSESKLSIVFDTTAESFRQMPAPIVPTSAYLFEMDGTLGIYSCKDAMTIVDLWVMQDYESEVWAFKYRVELPVAQIGGQFEGSGEYWSVVVASGDGDVLVLVKFGRWRLHFGSDGELIASFHRDGQRLSTSPHRLKQNLVPNTFFLTVENYVVKTSPSI